MGNRAFITLPKNETHYVHWNGGIDSIIPLLVAVNELMKEGQIKRPTNDQIRAAFVEFCGSPMELQDNSSDSAEWMEENGHYFFDYNSKVKKFELLHKFEVYGKKGVHEISIKSEFVVNPREYYLGDLDRYQESFKAQYVSEYDERVTLFKEALLKACKKESK